MLESVVEQCLGSDARATEENAISNAHVICVLTRLAELEFWNSNSKKINTAAWI